MQPLNDLISDENSKLKSETVKLTVAALRAFHQLKMRCITAPVLAFADFEKPFHLEMDASKDGLGAVLSQKQPDGKFHPVAYATRSLKGSEAKYHSSKLEFLALKWAVVNQFREYLQYRPFQVKTDNNPLTYVMSSPNLDATGHHWVAALANFNMSLELPIQSSNLGRLGNRCARACEISFPRDDDCPLSARLKWHRPPRDATCHGSVEDVYGFLQTDGFRRCAGLFSSIVTLKGGLSRWLPSSGGPCHIY